MAGVGLLLGVSWPAHVCCSPSVPSSAWRRRMLIFSWPYKCPGPEGAGGRFNDAGAAPCLGRSAPVAGPEGTAATTVRREIRALSSAVRLSRAHVRYPFSCGCVRARNKNSHQALGLEPAACQPWVQATGPVDTAASTQGGLLCSAGARGQGRGYAVTMAGGLSAGTSWGRCCFDLVKGRSCLPAW